jgi:hypothetical protein
MQGRPSAAAGLRDLMGRDEGRIRVDGAAAAGS